MADSETLKLDGDGGEKQGLGKTVAWEFSVVRH
jgi:hypothetical protein